MNVNGYETKTTFWEDFSIAERYNLKAIRDTFNRAFKEWKSNAEYLTELVLVMNWKLWAKFKVGMMEQAKLYDELWRAANQYALRNLKGKDLEYFLATTD